MIYEYHCVICDKTAEVMKPSCQCSREEICPDCHIMMDRVYTVPGINMMTISPADREACVKHKLDTGNELVCIGDDKKALQKIKPQMSAYDLPSEVTSKFEG